MKKTKRYRSVAFDAALLARASAALVELMSEEQARQLRRTLEVELGDERWEHDHLDDFLADCARGARRYRFEEQTGPYGLGVEVDAGRATVWVAALSREQIDAVFALFDGAAAVGGPRARTRRKPRRSRT